MKNFWIFGNEPALGRISEGLDRQKEVLFQHRVFVEGQGKKGRGGDMVASSRARVINNLRFHFDKSNLKHLSSYNQPLVNLQTSHPAQPIDSSRG